MIASSSCQRNTQIVSPFKIAHSWENFWKGRKDNIKNFSSASEFLWEVLLYAMKDGLIFDRMLQASKGNKRQGVTIKKEAGDTVCFARCCDDHERNQRPLLFIFFYELKIATKNTQINRLVRNRPLHVAGSHYTGCQSQDPVNCSESQDPWDILTSLTSRMFRFMGRLTLIWD